MKARPPAWILERAQQLLAEAARTGTRRPTQAFSMRREHLLEVAALLLLHVAQTTPRRKTDPLPALAQRVAAELLEVEREWSAGRVRTLDEALGWRRPKGWRFHPSAAVRRDERLRPAVYAVIEQRRLGVPTTRVFDEVGARYAVSGADLKRACYSHPAYRNFSRASRTKRKTAAAS
jgi:hypothetical protein